MNYWFLVLFKGENSIWIQVDRDTSVVETDSTGISRVHCNSIVGHDGKLIYFALLTSLELSRPTLI